MEEKWQQRLLYEERFQADGHRTSYRIEFLR